MLIADLVHENSASTGTGNLATTAVNGRQRFSDAFGTGAPTNVFPYFISNRDAAEYEFGFGHMAAVGTLARDTVLGGSNGTSLVAFSSGTKDVTNDVPAAAQWPKTAAKAVDYTIGIADRGKLFLLTGTHTLNLTACATLGDGFWFEAKNIGSGAWAVDPNGAEQIFVGSVATPTAQLGPGDTGFFYTDGSAVYAAISGSGGSVPVMQEFVAVASQATFAVTGGYTAGKLMVFRGGVLLEAADVIATDGLNVTFGTACEAGEVIKVFGYLDVKGAILTRYRYTAASSGQTVFAGTDDNGITLAFSAPAGVLIYVNGQFYPTNDYTTGTNSITLGAGVAAGSIVDILVFGYAALNDGISFLQSQSLTTAQQAQARQNIGAANDLALRGLIDGLITSNNATSPNSKIDIAAGVARDSTNAFTMVSNGTLTIDCGVTGANGIDAGVLANNTWYFIYLIGKPDGTVAGLASTSAAAPTLPGGYTYKRRIGAFRTNGAAQILAYRQADDEFIMAAPFQETTGTLIPTSATLVQLTVPIITDGRIRAKLRLTINNTSGAANGALVQSPDENSAVAGGVNNLYSVLTPGTFSAAEIIVRLNTAWQMRWSASASGINGYLNTIGWFDPRGRNG
jgi:hypothetical protein